MQIQSFLPAHPYPILFSTQSFVVVVVGENQLQVTQKHQNCIKCQCHITTSRGNNNKSNATVAGKSL